MFYEKDWFMREIKCFVEAVARLVFHRDAVSYAVADERRLTQTDLIHRTLLGLLDKGRICEAEDFLFEQCLPGNQDHLLLALDFYQRLNAMSDAELASANFSREEIYEGLRDMAARSGMDFYGL